METKSYTLNNTIQLIDINKDYTKFRTMYNITCDNLQDEFEYAIVSQKRLDDKQLNFKKSVGYIEDSFTQVDDKITDWYLVLKANKDTPCSVMVDITSLDDNTVPVEEPYVDSYTEPYVEPFEVDEQPLPRRKRIPKTRFRSKPIIHGDSDDDSSEDEKPKPKTKHTTTNSNKNLYKYIFIGLVIVLLIVGGLWWTGYLYKLPYLSKFKPTTPNPISPPQLLTVQQPSQPLPPPVLRPAQPQPLSIPSVSINTEPQQYIPDPNFINEMRDLKIDI